MADEKKGKKEKPRNTGRGIAKFPHLHAPDTKFDKAGVYSVKVNRPMDERSRKLIEDIDALMETAYEEAVQAVKEKKAKETSAAKRKRIKDAERADAPYIEEDDGTVTFSVKMKATYEKNGTTHKMAPTLFDSKGKPLPQGTKIGGGSEVDVSFRLNPFFVEGSGAAGVSLQLAAVMVYKLQAFGSADAGYFGFEKDEDGSSADDLDADSIATGEDSGEDGEDDEPANGDADEEESGEDTGKSSDDF